MKVGRERENMFETMNNDSYCTFTVWLCEYAASKGRRGRLSSPEYTVMSTKNFLLIGDALEGSDSLEAWISMAKTMKLSAKWSWSPTMHYLCIQSFEMMLSSLSYDAICSPLSHTAVSDITVHDVFPSLIAAIMASEWIEPMWSLSACLHRISNCSLFLALWNCLLSPFNPRNVNN